MELRGLIADAGDEHELWARTINPQFVRVLRTIGFDRKWVSAEGAHLIDVDGNRYLDMLGGFGMYNVGRNNPRVRAALVEALELDTPGMLAMGVTALPGLLADALLQRTPPRLAPTARGRLPWRPRRGRRRRRRWYSLPCSRTRSRSASSATCPAAWNW